MNQKQLKQMIASGAFYELPPPDWKRWVAGRMDTAHQPEPDSYNTPVPIGKLFWAA